MCNEERARRILAGERASALLACVEGGWDDFVAEGRIRRARTRADIVWDYMVERGQSTLSALEDVQEINVHGSPMWVVDGELVVRFKKFDREFLTRNVATGVQLEMARQQMSALPELSLLSCGYRLDRAAAGVDSVSIVKHLRRKVEWRIDLRELDAGVLTPATPHIPFAPFEERKLPRVVAPAAEADDTGA